MGRPPAATNQKQARPDSSNPQLKLLSDTERKIYELIRSKTDTGMWTADLKAETGFPNNIAGKALKSLQSKNLIKDVVNFRNKGRKIFMAVEFEPSKEISGGSWYSEGSLDTAFITVLRQQCRWCIEKHGVATIEMISDFVRDSHVFKMECSTRQVGEILGAMILDMEIVEVESTGMGDYSHVQRGRKCYRCPPRGKDGQQRAGALASIPCGVCPRIGECTPDGIISPKTCVYYSNWLGSLDF